MRTALLLFTLALLLSNAMDANAQTNAQVKQDSLSRVSIEPLTEMQSTSQNSSTKSRAVDVLILGEFGYHPSQMSYGAMFGVVSRKGRSGGYVKYMSNFNSITTSLECDNSGYDTSTGEILYFYDEAQTDRMSVTAGYMYKILKPIGLYLYGGAGYGYRTLAWRERYDNMTKVSQRSFKGVAADLGAIYRVGHIAMSAGVTTVGFQFSELNVGVGFIF